MYIRYTCCCSEPVFYRNVLNAMQTNVKNVTYTTILFYSITSLPSVFNYNISLKKKNMSFFNDNQNQNSSNLTTRWKLCHECTYIDHNTQSISHLGEYILRKSIAYTCITCTAIAVNTI